jgi:hypothetical protein
MDLMDQHLGAQLSHALHIQIGVVPLPELQASKPEQATSALEQPAGSMPVCSMICIIPQQVPRTCLHVLVRMPAGFKPQH